MLDWAERGETEWVDWEVFVFTADLAANFNWLCTHPPLLGVSSTEQVWIFLAIFQNEIRNILTLLASKGSDWGRWRVVTFSFWKSLITNERLFMYLQGYNRGRSFKPIFMNFTWLVRVHSWVNPTIFWKQLAQQNHRYGEKCAPKTSFSGLSQTYRVFWEKTLKLYLVPHFPK